MYLEHYRLSSSPFAEEPDTAVFFAETSSGKILQDLIRDVRERCPFITLTGAEGTGKTLLCRLLAEELDTGFQVVYLERPVGSFEELLRDICLELGMEPARASNANLAEIFHDLLENAAAREIRIVLIVDEAEKLFLAALERLVRLICSDSGEDRLQVVLAGRRGLITNLEQLSVYCSNMDLEGGYELEPFSFEETVSYLRYRLVAAGLSPDQAEDVFTAGAVEKMYATARGNPRLTNILAEESLQNSSSNDSFFVLLDHVTSQDEEQAAGEKAERSKLPGWMMPLLDSRKKMILAGSGGLLLILLVAVLIWPGGDGTDDSSVSTGGQVTQERDRQDVEEHPRAESHAKATESVRIPPKKKQRPEAGTTRMEAERGSVPDRLSGEELFRQRVAASAKWVAGAYRDKYTIQLMMLSAEQAESRLKEILAQDNYYGIRNQLYVLKKKTSPPTLFVFYGTYDSMDAARMSRNQMPLFLRKHHPYALAISDALRKTED